MEGLLEACTNGDYRQLKTLLTDPTYIRVALDCEPPHPKKIYPKQPNIQLLLSTAAESGQLGCVQAILEFGHDHHIPYETFITRWQISAAPRSRNDAILKKFIKFWPEVVNLNMGHGGHPLMQTLIKANFDLSAHLLDHGAHANALGGPDKGLGGCIRFAAEKLPLQYTTLLLEHGALVAESGAIRGAAERGHLDVLKVLIEHGGDVNERLWPDTGFFNQKKRFQKASETPLYVAALNGHCDVVAWLLERGANAGIGDLNGKTPGIVAREMGHVGLMKVLGVKVEGAA